MNAVRTALFIAFRSVARGQRSTSLLLVFVLSLSFVNLMFLSGMLGGIGLATEQGVVDNETSHIVIGPQEEPERLERVSSQRALRDRIEAIPGVLATSRRYSLAGSVSFDEEGTGNPKVLSTTFVGIDAAEDREVLGLDDNLVAGSYLEPADTGEIVLGADVAGGYGEPTGDDLGGAAPGDEVEVTFANGVRKAFTVKGVYKVGFYSGLGIISASDAEEVLSATDEASQILVRVDPESYPLDRYMSEIREAAPTLNVRKYTDLLGGTAAVIVAFQAISAVVTVVSIVVAAITLFVLIYVNAAHRRRQIGVLKAIGVKQGVIVGSYVFQSLFYTACAVVLGLGLVYLGLDPVLDAHPMRLPMGEVTLSLGAPRVAISVASLMAAGILAGLIPSRQVAKQQILEAIWGV